MLEYDRIDISEGTDIDKKTIQKNVIFVTYAFFSIKTVIMKNIYG